jgi:hypothetical protein
MGHKGPVYKSLVRQDCKAPNPSASQFPLCATCLAHIILDVTHDISQLLIIQPIPFYCYFIPLRANIFLITLYSKTLSLYLSLNIRE